ncbi:hypothetical protein FOXB_04069, partial [Fusarium oxysporum f. sp. conglutinans Fo5176]
FKYYLIRNYNTNTTKDRLLVLRKEVEKRIITYIFYNKELS